MIFFMNYFILHLVKDFGGFGLAKIVVRGLKSWNDFG